MENKEPNKNEFICEECGEIHNHTNRHKQLHEQCDIEMCRYCANRFIAKNEYKEYLKEN